MSESVAKNNPNKAVAVPPGMFIFSKPMRSPADLLPWRKHFTQKGIRSEIIETPDGRHYVLCREGDEANHDTLASELHRSVAPKKNVIRRLSHARNHCEDY